LGGTGKGKKTKIISYAQKGRELKLEQVESLQCRKKSLVQTARIAEKGPVKDHIQSRKKAPGNTSFRIKNYRHIINSS